MRTIQQEEEFTAFIPPDYALNLAHERIGGMVRYFMEWIETCPIWKSKSYVEQLATSAYLQGVEDCAVAMAKKGYKLQSALEGDSHGGNS